MQSAVFFLFEQAEVQGQLKGERGEKVCTETGKSFSYCSCCSNCRNTVYKLPKKTTMSCLKNSKTKNLLRRCDPQGDDGDPGEHGSKGQKGEAGTPGALF